MSMDLFSGKEAVCSIHRPRWSRAHRRVKEERPGIGTVDSGKLTRGPCEAGGGDWHPASTAVHAIQIIQPGMSDRRK